MRTLKLTPSQLDTILKALGIAEKTYNDIHQDIVSKTVTTRNSDLRDGVYKHYHEEGTKMANLAADINNSKLDV